ncbi:GNAT family N-acetyltransferase [Streptomyces sp. NPDC002004]
MTDLHETHDSGSAVISGGGLHLRRWRAQSQEDAEAWLRGHSDPDFQRWNTPLRPVRDLDGARAALCTRAEGDAGGTTSSFCVTDQETGAVLGHVGLNFIDHALSYGRVGYWILPEARGHGIATRALKLASAWWFAEIGLNRIELDHAIGHEASCRIAERCGYVYEGTLRGAMFEAHRRDAFRDAHLHARLATDQVPGV